MPITANNDAIESWLSMDEQRLVVNTLLTTLWWNPDCEPHVARTFTQHFFREMLPANNLVLQYPDPVPSAISDMRINLEEGVWMLPHDGDPATDWRLVWEFGFL